MSGHLTWKGYFFNFRDPLWRSDADGYCHGHAGTQIVTQILTCKHLGAWSAVGYPIPVHFTRPNPNPPPLPCPHWQLAPSAMTSSLSATITSWVLIPSVLEWMCQPSMTFFTLIIMLTNNSISTPFQSQCINANVSPASIFLFSLDFFYSWQQWQWRPPVMTTTSCHSVATSTSILPNTTSVMTTMPIIKLLWHYQWRLNT